MRASRRLITLASVFALSVPVAEMLPAQAAVAAVPAAAQPAGLSVKPSAAGADSLEVTWTRSTALRRYRVQYSMFPGMTNSSSVVVDGNGALLTGLQPNTRYYVRVEALSFSGMSLASFTPAASAVTAASAEADALNVATYNIRSVRKQGKGKSWKVRRVLLADAIKAEHLAVLGLQEAEHWKVAGGATQYQDIVNLLNAGVDGKPWRIVETSDTDGTRVAYDSSQVSLVGAGVRELASDHKPDRWVVYATFTQNSTGRQFFFANAHLIAGPVVSSKTKCSSSTTKKYRIRRTEAAQVVETINAKAGNLPKVLVGDMNAHKFHCPSNAPYVKFAAAGLVDPIDNSARQKGSGSPTAHFQTNTQFDSSNHYAKAPKRHPWPLGTDIDYVWVSRDITTIEYKMVVKINSAGKFIGPPPSDHNMVRATITIPG